LKRHFGLYRITVDTDGFVLILEESVRGEMEAKTALERHAHERRHDHFTVIESTGELPRHISGKWQHIASGRGVS
jgi:hypothetical protein